MEPVPAAILKIPTPHILAPQAGDFTEAVAALPESAGIYLISAAETPPHFSWSVNLKRRLTRLLVPSYTGREPLLSRYLAKLTDVQCWPAGSRLEASLLLYELAKRFYPRDYLRRLHLRMPWFVGLTVSDPFPRLQVLNRLPRAAASLLGPFRTRDLAEQYEQQVLALYPLRRCTEVLSPHPGHPGCIYGEMNQCLRPCQCAVTPEAYASESHRVGEFLSSNGKSSALTLGAAREQASAELDFEQAAQIHKRLEKVNSAVACRDSVVTAVTEFNGIALTRAAGVNRFHLRPMLQGYWQEPIILDVSARTSQRQSLDHEIREALARSLSRPSLDGSRLDQIALFSRWYYSSWRDGQWFPFTTLADLNYRRLVREISSLTKAENPQP